MRFDQAPPALVRLLQAVLQQRPHRLADLHAATEIIALAQLGFERLQQDLRVEVEALHHLVEELPLGFGNREQHVFGRELIVVARARFVVSLANDLAATVSNLVGINF